jgi:AcrR family transcriptional regulator
MARWLEAVQRGDQLGDSRDRYHHGGLREALIEAGIEMAREGGPDAVVLREATRRSSVSPNAAYRHFTDRQDLLDAVSAAAQGMAADRMEEAIASATVTGDAQADARQYLRAAGAGYLAFAREQPGLFRAAFTVPHDLTEATTPDKAGTLGRTPFQILAFALDRLVEAGALPAQRRENAELHAWSSVHGLGMLVIDGPLRGFTDDMVSQATERLLDMVDRGL